MRPARGLSLSAVAREGRVLLLAPVEFQGERSELEFSLTPAEAQALGGALLQEAIIAKRGAAVIDTSKGSAA